MILKCDKYFISCCTVYQNLSVMQSLSAQHLQRSYRIQSIDLLRGLVMVIMALDHVRDAFHYDLHVGHEPLDFTTTWPVLFLTRWITHFCAPVFVFLSGTSIFLYTQRRTSKKEVAFFLFTRGLWLMAAEIFIIGPLWDFDFGSFIMLQVIWAIGLSMVFLSVLQFLPYKILLVIGLAIVFGHNLLDTVTVEQPLAESFSWSIVHVSHFYKVTPGLSVFVLYPFLPWLGLMTTGYCLGKLYTNNTDASYRKKFLFITGIVMILLFIVVRMINVYGDMHHWQKQSTSAFTFLDFINTTKYPSSLLYILMTIGPALIFLSYAENITNWLSKKLIVFGKVPFFYYILHVFVIHISAILLFSVSDKIWNDPVLTKGYPLWMVYIVWLSIVIILYFPCRWYSKYKANHSQNKWLSYL